MPELAQRLGLDLADALARHRELLADLFQRVVLVHAQAEAHANYTLLARRERGERARRGLAQVRLDRGVDRQDRVLVLDEIAEVGILLVADRGFQRQRLFHYLEHFANLLERHPELLGKLLGRGFARRRFASTISFLACRASRSPFCTICTILRNSPISSPVSPASTWISWRCCLTFSLSRATRLFQPLAESFDTRLSQRGSSSEPW